MTINEIKLPVTFDGGNLEEHGNINLKFVKYLGMEIDLVATRTRCSSKQFSPIATAGLS
jgi:hypothetical protein